MQPQEYQIRCLEFMSTSYLGDHDKAILLASVGLCAEAGEIANKVKKVMEKGTSMASSHYSLSQELGDLLWYVAIFAKLLGLTLEEVMEKNIFKLQERHGREGYNPNYRTKE